jgi:membrane protease YdiL (CAAX protease family)
MRPLLWFLAVIVVSLLAATALAYPAYEWIHPLQAAWRIDKIASRLFFLFVLLSIVCLRRRLGLHGAEAWGWNLSARTARHHFAVGLVLGIVTMLPVSLTMIAWGIRPWNPATDGSLIVHALLAGIGSGLVVGLLEETLFRGLIQGAVTRAMRRPTLGIVAVAALFASVHFLSSVHIAHGDVTPASGLILLAGTLAELAHPLRNADAFCALFGVGLLTGLARQMSGHVLFPAGLHAGWVMIMRTTIGITLLPPAAATPALISRHDGYTGWLVTAFVGLFFLIAAVDQPRLRRWLQPDG